MKKIFSCMLALFAAVSLYAADLNIYASGLKATQNGLNVTVEYTLNTQADSLYLMLYTTDIEHGLAEKVTDAAALTAGAHSIQKTLPADQPGTYHWAIKAFADTTTFADVADDSGMFDYYLPQDVAVDNNFESPYFGRIYVSECMHGKSDGHSATAQNQTRGIYIYNADLSFANGQTAALQGYDGGMGGTITADATDERKNIKRIAIDDAGYVYVASRDAGIKGVYRMDPANPSADFVQVLAASEAVDAIGIVGNDLYTLEGIGVGAGTLNRYSMATLPVGAATATMQQAEIINTASADCDAFPDGRGGWWFSQNRWHKDTYPSVAHMTAQGVCDYKITDSQNADLLTQGHNASYRGVVTVNPEGNLLAMGSDKRAVVFSIAYDAETGVPTLTRLCNTAVIGGNIDGVAFDVANNLYVASASSERFYVYPMAKEANFFVTPAPAASVITIEGTAPEVVEHLYFMGGTLGWDPTVGTEMTKKSDNVFEGEFTFTADTSYVAFFSQLATAATEGDKWTYVNAYRYSSNAVVTAGGNIQLEKSNNGMQSCRIAPAGTYKLTVNLNEMKLYAEAAAPQPIVYRIKHPWDTAQVNPQDWWVWKECELQADGTWKLEDVFFSDNGCNISPKVLDQDWIAHPTLVGNPDWGDSCAFVINPNATTIAEILTITKLGEPNPDIEPEHEHLYEIGSNQEWAPSEGIEMTKTGPNNFQREFNFSDTVYIAFITVKPEKVDNQENWTLANQNRFGPAVNNAVLPLGTSDISKAETAYKVPGGHWLITINLNAYKINLTAKEPSAIDNINATEQVRKVVENGHVYIIRDGVRYDVTGARTK